MSEARTKLTLLMGGCSEDDKVAGLNLVSELEARIEVLESFGQRVIDELEGADRCSSVDDGLKQQAAELLLPPDLEVWLTIEKVLTDLRDELLK